MSTARRPWSRLAGILSLLAGCLTSPGDGDPARVLSVALSESVVPADGVSFTEVTVALDTTGSARFYQKELTVTSTTGRFLEAQTATPRQVSARPVRGVLTLRLIAPDTSADALITVSGETIARQVPVRFEAALPGLILFRASADTVRGATTPAVLTVTALRHPGEGVVSRDVRVELLAELEDGTPLTQLTQVQRFSAQQNEAVSFSVASGRTMTTRFRARLSSSTASVTSGTATVVFLP